MIEREQIPRLVDICDSIMINGIDEKKRYDIDTRYVGLIQLDLLLQTKGLYVQMILAPDMIGRYEHFVNSRTKDGPANDIDAIKIGIASERAETYRGLLQHLCDTLGCKKK